MQVHFIEIYQVFTKENKRLVTFSNRPHSIVITREIKPHLSRCTEIFMYLQTSELADSIDPTWIVSAQSPLQRELLDAHPHDISIFVEGAFRIWLRTASVSYFILRADHRPKPNVPPEDYDGMLTSYLSTTS